MAVIVVALASQAYGEVYSFEGNSRLEVDGWTLLQAFCDPAESIEDGWLVQHVELCPGFDPPVGQQLDYQIPLAVFQAAEEFFVEWRMMTNGDRAELPFTAPAALVTGNNSITYHITVANDQVRFIRDFPDFPVIWNDVQPSVPHTFRLLLQGTAAYALYIDGNIIDAGKPEGAAPASDSVINIRAKAKFSASTTRWDYIRFGTMPVDGSGDFDSDGDHDLRDFYFLHECISGVDRP